MKKVKELAEEIALDAGILLMVLAAALFFWLCSLFGIDLGDEF